MKKQYKKPKLDVVIINHDSLLFVDISQTNIADSKENQFFGEDDEMQEWNDIFSNDSQDPWDGVDDPWK